MKEYLSKEFIIKLLDAHLEDSRGAENYAYNIIKSEIVASPGVSIKHGHWIYWDGWCGNHDRRIEDAVCSECGYKHPVVRWERGDSISKKNAYEIVLNKLADKCPGCGVEMECSVNE